MIFSGADWQNFLMRPLMTKALAHRRAAVPCPSNIISFTADEGTQPIPRPRRSVETVSSFRFYVTIMTMTTMSRYDV